MSRAADRAQARVVRSLMRAPEAVVRRLGGTPSRNVYGAALDAHAQLLARLQSVAARPGYYEGTAAHARREFKLGFAVVEAPPPAGVTRTERYVDGAVSARRAFVYTPSETRAAMPALIYFHGGGFVVGDLDAYDAGCRAIAEEAGIMVISVDYRLAPEHRFPAAVDDGLAAFRWVAAHAAQLGLDPKRIAVGGDSAGGNVAAVTCLRARDEGGPRPCFQWLLYPATDMTRALASHREHAAGPFLDAPTIDWFLDNYLAPTDDRRDPRASPLFAASHAELPPTYLLVAGFDPLRDEGLAYAEKLRAASVPVTLVHAMTMVHGFIAMCGVVPAGLAIRRNAIEVLRRALHD